MGFLLVVPSVYPGLSLVAVVFCSPPATLSLLRAVELLLAALERLGVPMEWLRELLMTEGRITRANTRVGGVLKRFRRRERGVLAQKQQREEKRVRRRGGKELRCRHCRPSSSCFWVGDRGLMLVVVLDYYAVGGIDIDARGAVASPASACGGARINPASYS